MLCRGPGPAWLVCSTEPKAERPALDSIRRLGFQSWTPIEHVKAKRRGKLVDVARPYFPRYVFAGIDPHRDDWRLLEDVDEVEYVLTNNGRPSCVPSAWIDTLRHAEQVGAFDRTKATPNGFELGDMVRSGEGQFSGLTGMIVEFMAKLRSTTASKRARVLFEFMGRAVKVDLPVEHLEKL